MPPRRWQARLGAAAARLLPGTLFGRLASLLFGVALLSHVLALTLMFELGGGPGPRPPAGPYGAELQGGTAQSARAPDARNGAELQDTFPAARTVGSPRATGETFRSEGPPPDDFRGPPPHPGGGPRLHAGLLLDIGVRLGAVLIAAWVAARWLSQPVRRLADAARELGQDIHRAPLAETGTAELRDATRVFNQMQARIQRQIADRDRFVAAVSHDLRTPLTRLRLRAEALEHEYDRLRFGRDIREMDAMIRSTLDYLLGAAEAEAVARLDIAALVRTIADDCADAGSTVTVAGHAAPIAVQPLALQRCIANLVDNAVRYGGSAEIVLDDTPQRLRIGVADRGPGLAPEELAKVLQPFYRVEASRNRNSGGVGLGLAIADDIARRQGGRLLLENRPGGGLMATVEIARPA